MDIITNPLFLFGVSGWVVAAILVLTLRGMVPAEQAHALLRAIPEDFVKEQSALLRDQLLNDQAKWNDVIAWVLPYAVDTFEDYVDADDTTAGTDEPAKAA
jgi:hypothetical protein